MCTPTSEELATLKKELKDLRVNFRLMAVCIFFQTITIVLLVKKSPH